MVEGARGQDHVGSEEAEVEDLIDGVPIVGRVDGNIDLSQINMENVDHIEIVKGPMSVVYGTSALAGVINIITKKNTKDKYVVKANSYVDNNNKYRRIHHQLVLECKAGCDCCF